MADIETKEQAELTKLNTRIYHDGVLVEFDEEKKKYIPKK